jgi:hypothetical protein
MPLTSQNKKGDRQRTPRSPFGLPSKHPRPTPSPPAPMPSPVMTVATRAGDSLAAATKLLLWKLAFRSLPLMLPLSLTLLRLRRLK